MIAFQVVALGALLLLFVRDILLVRREVLRRPAMIFRASVLLAVGTAIAWPQVTQVVAEAIGIGRGADAALYLAVLMLLAIAFYHQTRTAELRRQLTEVVRHLAIHDARFTGTDRTDTPR